MAQPIFLQEKRSNLHLPWPCLHNLRRSKFFIAFEFKFEARPEYILAAQLALLIRHLGWILRTEGNWRLFACHDYGKAKKHYDMHSWEDAQTKFGRRRRDMDCICCLASPGKLNIWHYCMEIAVGCFEILGSLGPGSKLMRQGFNGHPYAPSIPHFLSRIEALLHIESQKLFSQLIRFHQ